MDEDTRKNKIEAGKKKLKRFMKKRSNKTVEVEKSTISVVSSPDSNYTDTTTIKDFVQEVHEHDGLDDGVEDLLLLSRRQIEKHQNDIEKRDLVILRLTSQLNASIEAQKLAHSERTAQADALAQEVNVLRLQLKEATEVLERYKHNGLTAHELSDARNKVLEAENRISENGIVISLLNDELANYKIKVENFNTTNGLMQNECNEKVQDLEVINAELSEKLRCSKLDVEKGVEEIMSLRVYIDELMKKTSIIEKELAVHKLKSHSVKESSLTVPNIMPSADDLPEHNSLAARGHLAGELLPSTDLCSWQVQAAQTNARLLHVLSNLVKMNLDIERDINTRLIEFGLTSQSSEMLNHDDDTGQSVGSREDCTGLSVGESPNLELTEDGPDLTPRAWDLFTSVAAYDTEVEGEDVVIGASRRLRCAVSHVLNLLSLTFDKTNQSEYKALLKRNEDLANDLYAEYEGKGDLQLSLVNSESDCRKLRSEKQALEDENHNLVEDKEMLSQQIEMMKSKIMLLEEQKDVAYEAKKFLEEQCHLLSSRLGEPERTAVHKTSSCSEITLHESSGLLQENTKLSSEKQKIQMQSNKERHNLSSRVQHLEITLEEMQMEKEEITERYQNAIKDLKVQIEAMEKQLQSSKKFQEEQDMDREQEREEYLKEIRKYKEALREKDKLHNVDDHLITETETLEQQLKEKIEENMAIAGKKEDLERELRHSLDKINDLKDVISEYEKQLEMKSKIEEDLMQKLANVSQSVSELEKHNAQLKDQLEEYNSSQVNQVPIEHLHDLQEQLASKSQDLSLLSQSHSLLQELRGQIHFLEAKVHRKTRRLETMNLVSHCSSPVSSDTSQTESHDGDIQNIPCSDGWEMSPRSVNWLELHRLEEKINRLIHLEEELMKQNKSLNVRLKELNELNQEKTVLQEKVIEQLSEISALKSHIEKQKHSVPTNVSTQHEVELEKALQLEREMKEHTIIALKQEFQNKLVQAEAGLHAKQVSLQKVLAEHIRTAQVAKDSQMAEDRCKQDQMYVAIQTLKEEKKELLKKLNKAEDEIEKYEMSIWTMRKEMEAFKNEIGHKEVELNQEIKTVLADKTCLIEKLQKAEDDMEKLEIATLEMKKEMETDKIQLEKDFQIVQNMVEEKEKELCILNSEIENQLRLEAELTVKTEVTVALQHELEEFKASYKNDSEIWIKQNKELSAKFSEEKEILKNKISVLESSLYGSDIEDMNIDAAKHKIVVAAETLEHNDENSKHLFSKIVYNILKQIVDSKVCLTENAYQKEIDNLNSTLQSKLKALTLNMKERDDNCEKIANLLKHKKESEIFYCSEKAALENNVKIFQKENETWRQEHKEMHCLMIACERKVQNVVWFQNLHEREITKQVDELKQFNKVEMKALENRIHELTLEKNTALKNLNYAKAEIETKKELYERDLSVFKRELKNLYAFDAEISKKLVEHKVDFYSSYDKQMNTSEEVEQEKEYPQKSFATLLKKYKDAWETICSKQIKLERQKYEKHLSKALKALDLKLGAERDTILKEKEKELRAEFNNELLKKIKAKAEEQHLTLVCIEKKWQEKLTSHEHNLKQIHQEEIREIIKNYLTQIKAKEGEISGLGQCYEQLLKVAGLPTILKYQTDYKHSATFLGTSATDINLSSDDTCSSCHEDLLQGNYKELFHKIEKEGHKLLMLTKSLFNSAGGHDFHHVNKLIQEKQRIIIQLKTALKEIKEVSDVSAVVNSIIPEVQGIFEKLCATIIVFKKQILDLQSKLDIKVCNQVQNDEHVNVLEPAYDQLPQEMEISSSASNHAEDMSFHNEKRSNSEQSFSSLPNSIEQKRSVMPKRSFVDELYDVSELELSSTSLHHNGSDLLKVESFKNESLAQFEPAEEFPWLCETEKLDLKFSQEPLCSQRLLEQHPLIAMQLHHLYWKYKRTNSYLKAVVYQKRYLMKLLTGYQATEEVILVTLALLNDMNINISLPKLPLLRHIKPRGKSLFRSIAFVIIAIMRMKFMIVRWHQAAIVPDVSAIEKEVDAAVGCMHCENYISIVDSRRSSISSTPTSSLSTDNMDRGKTNDRIRKNAPRLRVKENNAEPGHLMQYVFRLEQLHRQLGLSDFKEN